MLNFLKVNVNIKPHVTHLDLFQVTEIRVKAAAVVEQTKRYALKNVHLISDKLFCSPELKANLAFLINLFDVVCRRTCCKLCTFSYSSPYPQHWVKFHQTWTKASLGKGD